MDRGTAFVLVESGAIFDICKDWCSQYFDARSAGFDYMQSIGGEAATFERLTGRLAGVVFPRGQVLDGWTKPDKNRISYPKRRSKYYSIVKSLPGAERFDKMLESEVGEISSNLSYEFDGGSGSRLIGHWLGIQCYTYNWPDGPYLLEVPDFAGERERHLKEHPDHTVKSPVGSAWDFTRDGTRRILKEEWDWMAKKHELETSDV